MAVPALWSNALMTDPSATIPIGWAADSDDALMARLRDDPRALDILIQRWSARLSHFFYRLTGDSAAIDDLLQELFLRVYQARDTWSPQGPFPAWLYTIARRLVYDRSRTRSRKPIHRAAHAAAGTTTLVGKIPDDAPTPFTSLSKLEIALKVDDALQRLPIDFREAVVLCDLQHLSYDEAARVLDTNVKTLSTRLARGRERLREILTPYWEMKRP